MTGDAGARRELTAGLAGLGITALATRGPDPCGWELRCFRAVNTLPDELHLPVWVVMQLGALAAAPVTAAAALAAGDRRLSRRLLAGGSVAWVAAKVLKRVIGRARPSAMVTGVRVRGRSASGEGFPSGHAGVATALVAASLVSVDPELRPALATLAAAVAVARVYVGAHLPLDVLGGAALGLSVDGALRLGAGPRPIGRP